MATTVPHIKNPLTIIAIFAGVAETGGTLILPHISELNQHTYINFLMAFPFFLTTIFFLILYFKHKVLYAPSDYQDENHFVNMTTKQTIQYSSPLSKAKTSTLQPSGSLTPHDSNNSDLVDINQEADSPILANQLNLMCPLINRLINNSPPATRINELSRLVALLHISFINERNYRQIFGSQIKLLKKIDQQRKVTQSEAEAIYAETKAANHELYDRFSITLGNWISFLVDTNSNVNSNLCKREADGGLSLTPSGYGFLLFMSETNLIAEKPL